MTPKLKLLLIGILFALSALVYLVLSFWGGAAANRDFEPLIKRAKAGLENTAQGSALCQDAAKKLPSVLKEIEASGEKLSPNTSGNYLDEKTTAMLKNGYKALAQCQMKLKQFEAAVNAYQMLVDLDPQEGFRHGDLANALSKSNRHNEAMRSALLAIQLNPNVWQAHRTYGQALEAAGQLPAALNAYQQAANFAPPNEKENADKVINRLKEVLNHAPAKTGAP